MGFGLWKKIKQGFKKAGQWIHQKILKPIGNVLGKVVAPIAKLAAPIAGAINPAVGAGLAGIGLGADLIGRVTQNPKDELVPLLKRGMIK
jgi:hypothetical protein